MYDQNTLDPLLFTNDFWTNLDDIVIEFLMQLSSLRQIV